jgi:hypothetical protein
VLLSVTVSAMNAPGSDAGDSAVVADRIRRTLRSRTLRSRTLRSRTLRSRTLRSRTLRSRTLRSEERERQTVQRRIVNPHQRFLSKKVPPP